VKQFSPDWGWGLLAGTLMGIGIAMTLVEPYWITPKSKLRLYVAVAGVVGASLVVAARNWFRPKDETPNKRAAEPGAASARDGVE
jgi:hypothetical protein